MSTEIILTFAVLGITIILFVKEWLRVDVVALCVMLALPWLGLVEPHEALAGLSSNAVFSIIGVMILGYGVDRSGIMAKVTRPILRAAGSSERRLVSLVSAAVGAISAFMQNIGAAALFLPALLRIAKRTGLPESRLLMPVGFAAILGGTLTMVASGPLIILNDILRQGGQSRLRALRRDAGGAHTAHRRHPLFPHPGPGRAARAQGSRRRSEPATGAH